MKKQYQKPTMELEDFRLDVEIAAGNSSYNAAYQLYTQHCANVGITPTDEGFAEFLKGTAWDKNDGWCYFTAYIPS